MNFPTFAMLLPNTRRVAALVALTAVGVRAQAPKPDSIFFGRGDHIRIKKGYRADWSPAGTVAELGVDSLRLAVDKGDTIWIPRWSVFAVEVHRGEALQGQVVRTMGLIGFTAGAGAALVMCVKGRITCDSDAPGGESNGEEAYLNPEFILGAAGALAGALLGWAIAPEPKWQMVVWPRLDADIGVRRRHGVAVGFRYSF